MKFAIKTTILTALLGVSLSAQALKNDTDQPINIDSGSQSLDMNTNTVVFADGVTITQGSSVKYDLNSEFLTLTGDAELKQLDSFIKAPLITYDVKKQQLKATSGGKTRVKTVLIPNQLNQNKK